MHMPAMVELSSLSKSFGRFTAVDDISLNVEKGEVLGFLGPNGAGKSTTMRLVAGFLLPSSGTARVCGYDVEKDPVAVKRNIGYMAEGSPSYEDMTVRQFLNFIAEVRGLNGLARDRRVDEVIQTIELQEVCDRSIEVLSKGFKRRVGLAQAILHDPPVLILDEPTDGLDPNQKHHVRSLIRSMAADKAIIISTHILEEVAAVCSRAVIIGQGRLLADGTAEELLSRLPEHNAVCVLVDSTVANELITHFSELVGVAEINKENVGNNLDRLRLIPERGKDLLSSVQKVVRQNGIEFEELYRDRGELDDVFRQITTQETMADSNHA